MYAYDRYTWYDVCMYDIYIYMYGVRISTLIQIFYTLYYFRQLSALDSIDDESI